MHEKEMQSESSCYSRVLCPHCKVPLCRDCHRGLTGFKNVGSVPMSLANDNFYGYVQELLVTEQVTWLECAAASLVWSTVLIFYLEEPYGHLMNEIMEGPTARTSVRGNLFSFAMPWQDIESCCKHVVETAQTSDREKLRDKCSNALLPHDEDLLATVLNVHIVGGSKDLVNHLEGATIRPDVVLKLIECMRSSGYPGYEKDGPNSQIQVEKRMKKLYQDCARRLLFYQNLQPLFLRQMKNWQGKLH